MNLVLASELSSAHAEVVAISLAHLKLGSWNLAATVRAPVELVVNWRPCVMCYGATKARCARTGRRSSSSGIQVITDVLRDDALAVFRRYGDNSGRIVYNGRR